MVSLKKKQSGFTIVELLIVIVIIGILAALVITTFVGIQQRARNSERQTDINSVSSQLEGYFAKNSGYPTLDDLNDAVWREGNDTNNGNEVKLGDSNKAAADPSNKDDAEFVAAGTGTNGAVTGRYVYVPGPASCVSPTNNDGESSGTTSPCTSYTLIATLEGNNAGIYEKQSAN